MECNGMECSVMERYGIKWNVMERNVMECNYGMKCSVME
jgi:hypothetical protein